MASCRTVRYFPSQAARSIDHVATRFHHSVHVVATTTESTAHRTTSSSTRHRDTARRRRASKTYVFLFLWATASPNVQLGGCRKQERSRAEQRSTQTSGRSGAHIPLPSSPLLLSHGEQRGKIQTGRTPSKQAGLLTCQLQLILLALCSSSVSAIECKLSIWRWATSRRFIPRLTLVLPPVTKTDELASVRSGCDATIGGGRRCNPEDVAHVKPGGWIGLAGWL